MPYEKGGRADKKGNKYEINCIVYELLKVLDGSNYSVVIEALGEDEKGTDILVTNHEGKKEHQQCKARNGSSDNWTISDLKARKIFNAWKIQLDRECDRKVALVSPMTCSFLVDLNDRANNTSGKADEFYDFQIMNSSKEFQSFYENFCKEMNIEIGRESGILKSIDYLKRIYYKQISEYEIQELITQNIQYQFSSPKDMVYDAFVSMIVSKDILGRELTQIALIDYIEKKNIKFQLREDDGRIGFRIKELNQEYRESFRTLQEGLIHRKEFDNCIKYIMDGKGVVITGNAGYGKSGCTEAILNFCEDANIPCIAIKLDRRIPHKNCKNWGEELGLPGSIAYCIHTISRNENAIIILDQLDALRWTQSNSSEALSICMELIRQVECLNYNRAKKISIVFVCRTYDFENDNNIRALFENREREEEIWKVIEIGKFEEETVGRIVGDIYKDLSVKLKNLLQIPSNLYIWQHLDKKQIYGECLTTSNLIDKWFDQICKRSTEVGISSKLVADTTNKIVDTLDGMGRLFAPKMIINIDITGLEYLISAEIIVLQNNKIGFVHQSILDYFVSKRMMEKQYAGQSIENIMGEKEKQTPGKRYQLQMFLQNILEVDTEEFVLIGEELLNSNNVRYYMKFVFYELMGQIQKPDENIIKFFLENCDNVIWGKYLINNVALSRKQYVGILMENGMLERWYSEKDKKSQVFKLLVSISPKLGNNEIEFIRNHAFEDSENDKEFMKCFLHDITEESDEMFELRMLFYEHYPEYAANDYVDVKTMMLKFEERTLRLLSFWIDKKIDSKGKNVYRYEEELVDGKNDFMVKNETMILDRLLKYVPKETGTGVIYSEWSNKYLHKRGIERACVELIKKANIVLCSKRPEEFWEYYNPYMGKGYTVFNEIILHGLAFMPSKYSNQIIEYISLDFDNNIFDYTSGKDNYLESVKEILNVHTVSCSEEVLKKLEEKICYYKSPNAVRWYRGRIEQNKTKESAPVYWSFWGDLQYELLPCLPEERISEKSRELLRILRRKFYNGKSHYYSYNGHYGSVSSPVSGKNIGKKQWLQIITNNNIKNKQHSKWTEVPGGFMESSLEMYSSDFQRKVSENPQEMIQLVMENKEKVLTGFVDALFLGVEVSEKIKEIDFEILEKLFITFPCNLISHRAIYFCEIIEKTEKIYWRKDILMQLKRIAIERKEPEFEINEKIKDCNEFRSHSLYCGRGSAARAIGHLLWENKSLLIEFKDVVEKMSLDINPMIRMAALNILFPSYNIEREWAEEKILQIYESDIRTLSFYDSKEMLFLLYPKYKERICSLIEECFLSEDKEIQSLGGYCICEFYIRYNKFETIILNIESKSEEQIKAILDMAVVYLEIEDYRKKAKRIILQYIDTETNIESSISTIFYNKAVDANRDKDFLIELMNSKISRRIVYAFMHYLEKSAGSIVEYADIIFELCSNVLNMSEKDLRGSWGIDRDLSKLIISLYDETSNTNRRADKVIANRCLELWDIMFERQLGSVREISKKLMDR